MGQLAALVVQGSTPTATGTLGALVVRSQSAPLSRISALVVRNTTDGAGVQNDRISALVVRISGSPDLSRSGIYRLDTFDTWSPLEIWRRPPAGGWQ